MVFPQGTEWDNEGYSGDQFVTRNGIQPIFYRKIIETVTSPLDATFDYYSVPEQPDDPKVKGGAGVKPAPKDSDKEMDKGKEMWEDKGKDKGKWEGKDKWEGKGNMEEQEWGQEWE